MILSRVPGLSVATLLLALVLAGCSADEDAPTIEQPEAADLTEAAEPEEESPADEPPPCRHDGLELDGPIDLSGPEPIEVAAAIADRTHTCAPTVVLTPADGGSAALLAVAVALAADAPLLLHDPQDEAGTRARLAALEVEQLVTVGMPADGHGAAGTAIGWSEEPVLEDGAATGEPEPDPPHILALQVAEHLGSHRFLAVPDDPWSMAAGAARTTPSRALLPIPSDSEALSALAAALPGDARLEVLARSDAERDALAERLLGVGLDAEPLAGDPWGAVGTTTWLGDPTGSSSFAAAAVAALDRGEAILPVDGSDLRTGRADTARLRGVLDGRVVLFGELTPEAPRQLELVSDGPALPNGGFRLFEDERMVALYGHPGSAVLGALGEQDLDATVERLRAVAQPYAADGLDVLPAFEIITTIASAEAGPLGDFSRRTAIGQLRPWVDRAAEEGIYVVLDLQPGRTDFLTQAMEYEELLREPHVGLALDPEWRLEEDQRHLRQIGSVGAGEVQQVADWLAELTREAKLPEKLLVLHQFRFSMLPDRDTIEAPTELAVVVHMDGQGPIATKYDTYAAITRGQEDRWLWGWKNFYDEDLPTPSPSQVLELDPLPVFVSYQ